MGSSSSRSESAQAPVGIALCVLASPVGSWAEDWLALPQTLGALLT